MKPVNLICSERKVLEIKPKEDLSYIYVTQFDDSSVSSFYKEFTALNNTPSVKVIPVVISSYGGQLHCLFAMLDIIRTATKPVATVAMGKAMSCGSALLAAGTKGYRYAAPSTDIMIHEVAGVEFGKNSDVQNGAKQMRRLNNQLFCKLSEFAGKKDPKFFQNEMKRLANVDWFLSAAECKKLGLIDHVSLPNLIVT